jgi:hypothetical protein
MKETFARTTLCALAVAGICVFTEGTRPTIAAEEDSSPTVAFIGLVGRGADEPERRKVAGAIEDLVHIHLFAMVLLANPLADASGGVSGSLRGPSQGCASVLHLFGFCFKDNASVRRLTGDHGQPNCHAYCSSTV